MSIYIYKSFNFKIRHDLNITCRDVDSFSIKIISNTVQITLVNVFYRPKYGLIDSLEIFLKNNFSKTKKSNKMCHIAVDFKFINMM